MTITREGILYRGADGGRFLAAWGKEFSRMLTEREQRDIKRQSLALRQTIQEVDPGNREALDAVDDLLLETAFADMPRMPHGRPDQPRRPNGQFDFGRR